ncbi:MAG: chromosomal replication initiator protein DnaA [Kiritimatiellae bacterium]|nr:chromosomal replication initiator protein DnaA [Kiritimatiellia bacterium]
MNETIDINSKQLWERAKSIYLSTLQSDDEKSQVERYFSMITSVTRKANVFVILTSNAYAADFLKIQYASKFKSCLNLAGGENDLDIEFKFDETARPAIVMPEIQQINVSRNETRAERISTFSSTMPLNEEYTFDEFVRGPSNSWALAAAQGVVANPGKSGYNPLFIHGGTGLGKTHLMQAIGNELHKKNPHLAICYLTAETFLNEYVNALKNTQAESFRNRYRNIDLLMVDDVQFLQKGKQFQEEFFNTFNALQQAHKQIVMTSDVAPKNLPLIEERLISRFEGGMVQEIESPNYETRLAILKKKSEGMTPQIPDNALEYIADNIKSHVRAMEGALRKVSIFRSMDPATHLSNEILSRLLNDFIEKEKNFKKLTIEEIQSAVAKKYSVDIGQILSMERTQSLVTPRQLAMYIARKFTTKGLPEIAELFKKTHSTVIHGVKSIEKRLDVEEELKASLEEVLSELGCKLSDKIY